MRRNAKGTRAPLAPLHDNSLKGDSSHHLLNGTKMDAKQSAARVTNKPAPKSSTNQVKLPDKAVAVLARSTYPTGNKTAGKSSPVKPRKSVQLVTTSAAQSRSENLARIKQAVRKPGRETKPAGLGRPTRQLVASASAARQTGADTQDAAHGVAGAPAGAESTEPLAKLDDAEPDAQTPVNVTQRHWRLPGTPPSIRALLGPLHTPAAAAATANRDVQYMTTQQQTVSEFAVQGAGTPQNFSDVFDLDEVTLMLENTTLLFCALYTVIVRSRELKWCHSLPRSSAFATCTCVSPGLCCCHMPYHDITSSCCSNSIQVHDTATHDAWLCLIDVSASLVPYHILCSMTTFSSKQYPITSNGPAGEWADSRGGSNLCGVP